MARTDPLGRSRHLTLKSKFVSGVIRCRSLDGRILVVASTDGYCTLVTFEEGELGHTYRDQVVRAKSSEQQSTANIEQVQKNFNQELRLSDPVEVG